MVILDLIKNFILELFKKPIDGYQEFLNKLGITIQDEKKGLIFFISILVLAVLLLIIAIIISVVIKKAKIKKANSKKQDEESSVEDAISVLEEKDEKAKELIKENKQEEVTNNEVKEAIEENKEEHIEDSYVDPKDTPTISVQTVDEAAPVIEENTVVSEKIVKENRDDAKDTKVSTNKPLEKEEIVEPSKNDKKKQTNKVVISKVEQKEEDDNSTSEFLIAALQQFSNDYDNKLNERKKSKKAESIKVVEQEIKENKETEEKTDKIKEENKQLEDVKLDKEINNESKEEIEALEITPSIIVSLSKIEEYDPEKHSTRKKKNRKKVIAQGKYTISKEIDDYRYRLLASNGEIMFTSEPYASESSARKGIVTFKNQLSIATIDIVEEKHGLVSFRVLTKQGRCLGTSANYKTRVAANNAIESLKRFALAEKIEIDENKSHYNVEEFVQEVELAEGGKFRIIEKEEKFTYQLSANNGRIIATSNIYSSKETCLDGLEKFREMVYDGSFLIYRDKNDKYQFKLYNKQKRLVLAGEVYDDKHRATSVIESIKKFAKNAIIVED